MFKEITTENSPNPKKDTINHIQEDSTQPSLPPGLLTSPRLKIMRTSSIDGVPIHLAAGSQAGREWDEIFTTLKETAAENTAASKAVLEMRGRDEVPAQAEVGESAITNSFCRLC